MDDHDQAFALTKAIPAPPKRARTKYPLDDMKPGDSFAVPYDLAYAARSAITHWRHRHPGYSYTTRIRDEDGHRVVRVWCIEAPDGDRATKDEGGKA